MKFVHTSEETDMRNAHAAGPHPYFDEVFFFVGCSDGYDDEDCIDSAYDRHGNVHVLHIPDGVLRMVEACQLDADKIATDEILRLWGDDVDVDDAISGAIETFLEESIEDGAWHIQRIRAQLGRRLGFHAVQDWDEQGTVVMIDFEGRHDELLPLWRMVG